MASLSVRKEREPSVHSEQRRRGRSIGWIGCAPDFYFTAERGSEMIRDSIPEDANGPEFPWTDTELRLVALVMEMMDRDPTCERLERVFKKALDLVRFLKKGY